MRQLIIALGAALLQISCNTCNQDSAKTSKIFPEGNKATEHFTGDTWVKMLTVDGKNFDAMSYNVKFAAGSRTDWHSHPGGQILYCTSGEGRYQEKGQPVQKLNVGDVVEIKPDIVHWHGAAPNSEFIHLGISTQLAKGPAEWYGPLTDEEYK